MRRPLTVALASVALGLVQAGPAAAAESKPGGHWPQFHGPNRDNISTETGLLSQWPEGGPKLAWKFSECGGGFANVTVVDGLIYTSGDFGRTQVVLALDLDGKLVWKTPNGRSWTGPIPGARTTPTYDRGVVYHMSPAGRLAALKAKSGEEVWAVDLRQRFGAKLPTWSLSENVIVDGKAVLCSPGGPKGRVVALDKATGETLWANTEIAEIAAYCSPIIATHKGVRQLITIMQKSIVSVDAATGKLLWTHAHPTKHDQNVMTPIYRDGRLYASSGHGTGGRLLQIADDSRSAKELWHAKDLDNCHGGVILRDGYVYGSGCRLFGKGFVCVDLATGKTMWNEKRIGKVSMAFADGRLYCLTDTGRMWLIEPDPKQCKVVGRFDVPKRKGLALTHPVVCGRRLYVRNWNTLLVYDVSDPARKTPRDKKARPPDGPTSDYPTRRLEGWTLRVHKDLLAKPNAKLCAAALRELEVQFHHIRRAVPAAAVEKLQKVTIWLEYDNPKGRHAHYHPSAGWLKANGYNVDKVKCVEIGSAKTFLDYVRHQPWMVLHELAHAYHDQVLGWDHPKVKAAYEAAKKAGTYEKVLIWNGRLGRHYAMTNHKEYFSETTEAYFGTNDIFPFVKAELKRHDPNMHALLAEVWGVKR